MNNRDKDNSDYKLVWSDEFSGDSASFLDWNIEARPAGANNNELQEYVQSDENIYVKNNMLYIRPVRKINENKEFSYTSGFLTTKGKTEFTYGKFEVRLKIPEGIGFIPFFKLCSDVRRYGKWPTGGQIDIMMIPTRTPEKLYATVHYGAEGTVEQAAYAFPEGNNASDDFHTYCCEWVPGSIKFSVDGEMFFEANVDSPFNHPMYLHMGMAIGGNLAGPPSMTTVFSEENSFIVDYIRVYQKDEYATPSCGLKRKMVAVCGSWEDAENFNIFLKSLQTPEFQRKYLTAAFTFGALGHDDVQIDEQNLVDYVGRANPSAIIIFAQMIRKTEIVEALVRIAREKDIPVFMFEKTHPDAINVLCDYDGGFEEVCRHIIEYHGARDVDMFAGFRGNEFSDTRIKIFRKVLEENDIVFDERKVHYGDFWDEAASMVLTNLINSKYQIPEAIISANDSMALGIEGALSKAGYVVPDDVKLIGFDGIRETSLHNPPISSCSLDYSEFVGFLMEVLADWAEGEPHEDILKREFKIGYKTFYRFSCGCTRCENPTEMAELVSASARDNTDNFRHMYEMSRFVSQAVQIDNFYEALSVLEQYLWLWTDQYYFVGRQGSDEKLRVLFSGYQNKYKHDHRYMNLNKALPDIDVLAEENSGINILLFKQIRVHSDDFVFAATGLNSIPLRSEQRFEEFSLFMSTVLNSVYNNQNYVRVNKEIEKLSESDYLTGLYNRRGFIHEIERRIKAHKGSTCVLSLFSVDMDGLKYINDTFGHAAGDIAITVMADSLLQYAGAKGICARYGGDEFAFAILSDNTNPVDLGQVHLALDEIIKNNPKTFDQPFKVGASIGFVQRIIDDAFDFEDVVREADKMMYEDKRIRKSKKQ